MQFVRLLAVSVGAFAGGLLFLWVFAIEWPVRIPGWLGLLAFAASWVLGGIVAWRLSGRPKMKLTSSAKPDYEKLGLLGREEFAAQRAFEVEEFEDEGPHFFIELEDGRVLFLCGQYLYHYEEITDDPELNQPATFPCTRFVITRHKTEHWVHSIECQGTYLKPEALLPHYSKAYLKTFGIPHDGEIFNAPYDELFARIKGSPPL
jgi:hypothetical protein